MRSPLASVVSDSPSRDTRQALLRLMREDGLVAIRLRQVEDPERRKMIEVEAIKQMGEGR